ncbi:ATP-binding protein [Carboxydothermus hydrogenoformans]|uniref:ATP-binding protein n=1 Tax=Carboxydothermus hydrogenoformans TaxID=129958 RepID=UPI000674C2D6|nr:ATP-binding protein [Carboxydothermus hydrogenoformans]
MTNSFGKDHEYCPDCKDRGIIIIDNNTARICHCQEQKRLERLFKSSQITPAFRAKTFENFVTDNRPPIIKAMFECARDYAQRFTEIQKQENNWLVFLGEPGAGKTHLSMAVANWLLARGIPTLYFQHVEGLGELKDLLRKQGEEGIAAKLEQMKKVELLIWDDLFWGKEQPREFELEITFEVLNYRYLNLKPTIISSNRTPQQLLKIDNGTIGSRIVERGKGHMVVVQDHEANYRLMGE